MYDPCEPKGILFWKKATPSCHPGAFGWVSISPLIA